MRISSNSISEVGYELIAIQIRIITSFDVSPSHRISSWLYKIFPTLDSSAAADVVIMKSTMHVIIAILNP